MYLKIIKSVNSAEVKLKSGAVWTSFMSSVCVSLAAFLQLSRLLSWKNTATSSRTGSGFSARLHALRTAESFVRKGSGAAIHPGDK